MNLLLDDAMVVQYEAFRLMQLFVQARTQFPGVERLLRKNKDALLDFFADFLSERGTSAVDKET